MPLTTTEETVLTVPELSLVLLIGASGSGKSTFGARCFGPHEVLSSDHYRAVVSNDEGNQEATQDAFDALEFLARKRLARGLLTVIDATNVDPQYRKRWVRLAREFHVLPVAIALSIDPKVCVARNAERAGRDFHARVVRRQHGQLKRGLRGLKREGFRYVHVLHTPEEVESARVERPRPWTDRRDDHGPFDLIGDVHGCFDELRALLQTLGYAIEHAGDAPDDRWVVTPPDGRRALFLGDLVDRGPASDQVLHLAMDMVEDGAAVCIPGNHEAKLQRWLEGRSVRLTHGLERTAEQLEARSEAFRARVLGFLRGLVSHFVLDEGRLVVAHAGMREDLAGRASGRVRQFALYGDTTGESDAFGLPVRYPWAREYAGKAAVVYGHTPVPRAEWLNNTLCIDTGCVFGGELTALRWPEREIVSVPAAREYYEPVRPLQESAPAIEESPIPSLDGLIGGGVVETRFGRTISVRPENAVAALEVLSRFAVDPRWLIHLPPTMSPSETSRRDDLLEHPDEAFAYFRKAGVAEVICQEKHMGSRALVVLCRSVEATARFGFAPDEAPAAGVVLSRRGRRFFDDDALESAFLERLRGAAERSGLWDELESDWVLLDAELMPWSAKARSLLEGQYAPVGTAARTALGAALDVIRQAAERQDVGGLVERYAERHELALDYAAAYRRYCWEVNGLDDYRLAPFHVLASEGAVHDDKAHCWHLDRLERFCAEDPLLLATPHRTVTLADEDAVAAAVQWWEERTAAGGEGMVIKPATFLTWAGRELVQPALKCRGREYLRIIYGPEYTRADQMKRLRSRATGRKRSLAAREFLLGLEGLHRFVERRSPGAVHDCVFAILALEAEPVDPRL